MTPQMQELLEYLIGAAMLASFGWALGRIVAQMKRDRGAKR